MMLIEIKSIKERNKEIKETLRENGYSNESINYKKFLRLYKPFIKEMSEKDFARILGISDKNYGNIKYNGGRATILKEKKLRISNERKEEIVKELKEKGYENKSIYYKEFLSLYKPFSEEMSEKEFAYLLGITDSNYDNIKNKGRRTRILKEKKLGISDERKEKIIKELRENGYSNESIYYKEFLSLYKPFSEEMPEKDFAYLLDITDSNYKNMKNKGTRARILKKEQEEITDERKEEIIEELIKNGHKNGLINYKQFLSLYEAYSKEMTKQEFADILGITETNLSNMKYNKTKGKIQYKKAELDRIKYQVEQNDIHSKIKIENMCRINNITLYEFLEYIYGDKDFIEELIERENIYIEKCEMPKEFRDKYANKLLYTSQKISRNLTKIYKLKNYEDDFSSEALMYIFQNRGDIVKNAQNEEKALTSIKRYIITYLKYRCLKKLKPKSEISLDDFVFSDSTEFYHPKKRKRYEIIGDKNINIEDEVEHILGKNDSAQITAKMRECYDKGMNSVQAIKIITEEYGIGKEELLQILEEELERKRTIGSIYSGEELE